MAENRNDEPTVLEAPAPRTVAAPEPVAAADEAAAGKAEQAGVLLQDTSDAPAKPARRAAVAKPVKPAAPEPAKAVEPKATKAVAKPPKARAAGRTGVAAVPRRATRAATAAKPARPAAAPRQAEPAPKRAKTAAPAPASPAAAPRQAEPAPKRAKVAAPKPARPAAPRSAAKAPAAPKAAAPKPAKPAAASKPAKPAAAKPAAAPKAAKQAAASPAKPVAVAKPAALAKPAKPAAKRRFNPFAPISAYARFAERALGRMMPEQTATPEKLIDQIAAGKQGPQVIAAFDFDGTLIGGLSGAMVMRERMRRKEVSRTEIADTIGITFKTMARLVEANELVAKAFAQWKGKSEAEMEELGAHLYEHAIQDSVFPEMREIVEAHRRAGHTMVVATSASRFQVEPTVKALGIDNLLCTQLEVAEGKLTGNLVGDTLFGIGKINALKRFIAERGGNLADVHFYADGSEEIGLLEAVGHPHPVNPGGKLTEVAKNKHWPVLRLSSRGSSKPIEVARGLRGMMSLLPNLYAGVAVGAITRDRRAIANTVMPAWIDKQLQMAGVKLRVSGRKNLWVRRPAVFIFNHRNNFDGSFCAALVRTDYVAIAKKDMSRNPLGKLVAQLMPTVFIERGTGNAEQAAETLKPVVEAVREGYSIMLAPEGTRVRGHPNSVGSFKKGAFHMAIEAGIPIVPVVIRNALDVAARDAPAMRPGVVDIAVLPPISVEGWDRQRLSKNVEEIRQLYIETLNNWPAPDEPE